MKKCSSEKAASPSSAPWTPTNWKTTSKFTTRWSKSTFEKVTRSIVPAKAVLRRISWQNYSRRMLRRSDGELQDDFVHRPYAIAFREPGAAASEASPRLRQLLSAGAGDTQGRPAQSHALASHQEAQRREARRWPISHPGGALPLPIRHRGTNR